MKRYIVLLLTCVLLITAFLISCPSSGDGDGDGEPVSKTISGTIHDSYSTEPIGGVTVSFGDTSTTTNNSGAFSLTITQTPEDGKIKGSFLMYCDGYNFFHVEELLIDVDTSYDLSIPMNPQSFAGYTMKEITGDVFYSDGTTEISMLASLVMNVFNDTGDFHASLLYFDPYSFETPVFGDDCLISGCAELSSNPFIFIETSVDLSGDSPITLDITEPSAETVDTISITFNTTGNTGYGMFSTPYGFVPVIGRYLYDGGVGEETWVSEILNSDQTSEDVDIYNPENWQVYWRQEELDTIFNSDHTGHEKRYVCSGSIGNVTSSVNLPAIDTSLGPDEPADPASLTFSEGELSQTAVTGADIYYYTVSDDNTDTSLGEIISFGEAITLPDAVLSIFEGRSVRFNFKVQAYDTPGFDLDSLENFQSIPPDTNYGEVKGSGEEYLKVIDF